MTQLRATFSLMLLILVGACANHSTYQLDPDAIKRAIKEAEPPTPVVLTAQQIEWVKEGVREELKDPDSAKFEGIVAMKDVKDGGITVCGFVNARNSFGGYVGKKPFFGGFGTKGFVAIRIGGDKTSTLVAYNLCNEYGIYLDR